MRSVAVRMDPFWQSSYPTDSVVQALSPNHQEPGHDERILRGGSRDKPQAWGTNQGGEQEEDGVNRVCKCQQDTHQQLTETTRLKASNRTQRASVRDATTSPSAAALHTV